MGALRSDGINDVVSLPAGSTSGVGTTAYTWWIKGTLRTAPSGVAGILGTSSAATSSGFVTNSTLQLRVYSAGQNRYGTGDNFFEVGVYHHYRLEHDAGGAWRAYRDNMTTPVASGTFTGSFTFGALNQMFRSSNSATMWSAWDMEEMGITSTTFSETYQANLSGGTGSVLPTVSGNNNGSLVNFPTDNSQWVGFGAAYTVTGTGALTFGGAGNAVQWYVARGTSSLTLSGNGSAWQTPYTSGTSTLTLSGAGRAVNGDQQQYGIVRVPVIAVSTRIRRTLAVSTKIRRTVAVNTVLRYNVAIN